jgi:hypothetical protein
MKSYFMQREGDRLYGTIKTSQQEYGAEFVLNGSKPSVTNLMQTFLASLVKSASKLSSAFHSSLSDGCTITLSFSHTPSLCHLTLQENIIDSSVLLNSSVLMNVTKIRSFVPKTDEPMLRSSVWLAYQ